MIEMTLEEDLPAEFRGGTLQLSKGDASAPANASDNDKGARQAERPPNVNNNCQWRSFAIPNSITSMIPNKITETIWTPKPQQPPPQPKVATPTNDKEKSLQPAVNVTEDANNFFTFRDGVIDRAVQECVEQFLDIETEGPLQASFLLTQINHWDTDKERLILLATKSLVVVKYDFIALKRLGYKKIPIEDIQAIIIGDLVYPNGSLIPDRHMKGIRIMFGTNKSINFAAKWNPFNEDVPYWTFTFHPLYFHKDCTENQRKLYSVDFFIEILCTVIEFQLKDSKTRVLYSNILLENYIGLGSIIHNRNELGFFKVRGKFSF